VAVLTPDVINSRHLNTGRSAGIVLIEVFSNGPLERAGFRPNDIIDAGIPANRAPSQ